MPTVLVVSGYRFMIYTDDHAPAHVHVRVGNKVAKILLEPVSVESSGRFNRGEIRKIVDLTVEHRNLLLEAWDKQFPKR